MREPTDSTGPLSVALVDDAADIRMLLRAQLQADPEFYVCAEGSDGTSAVVIAREGRPDVMLLDLCMPEMDGLDALPLILAESPGTAVVVLSAGVDPEVEARAATLGAAGCLTKTLRAGPLPDRLRAVLAQL
jgi:DNA-binding NarL/FixJ family response regulator